jgi:predicted nucleic acid-binding protein
VTDKVIINASPLIFLSRSHHLDLLKSFADEVWVPEPVAKEILYRGQEDITAQAIKNTAWLITQPVEDIPMSILEWRLGAGESAVLALSLAHSHTEVIIDDLAGRKCADSLDIPVRGTLGLVLAAKKRGVIPKARPIIEDMMSTGLYLSKRILDRALEKVGE